jgi:hypothetical protein
MEPLPGVALPNERGLLLGLAILAVLIAPVLAALATAGQGTGELQPGASSVFIGLYLMAWATMFLLSYFSATGETW